MILKTYNASGTLTSTTEVADGPAPTSITMRQCRLQLLATDDLATVNSAVAGMGAAAVIEWEYSAVVERSNPLVAGIASLLSWDASDLDTYFRAASLL